MLLPLVLLAGCNEGSDVKVISFNIRYANPADGEDYWENRKQLVSDLIAAGSADFVGVQEALPEQVSWLAASLPMYTFIWRSREVSPMEGEAVPLLYLDSIWEMQWSETFWLSDFPEVAGSNTWNAACNRVTTWGLFMHRVNQKQLVVCNTHFDHISQEARLKGAELILSRLDSLAPGIPRIIMGDLNGTPDNPAVQVLTSRMQDPWSGFYPEDTVSGTFHGFKGNTMGKRIDYILLSSELSTSEVEIIHTHHNERYPSDHFPVMTRFRF